MHRAAKVALGCLFAPVGLLVIALLVLMSARLAGVPESRQTETSFEQRLPETSLATRGQERDIGTELQPAPNARVQDQAVRVVLDLEEGMFTIFPGPAEEGIKVDADYDEGVYELTQGYDLDEERPVYRLQFRSKVHWLRRLAQDGSFADDDFGTNRIDIQLPLDTPMELMLAISKSETDVDLSGLSLSNLVARFSMGEFHLESREDNPIPMDRAVFNLSMGESKVRGLSALGAQKIDAQGSMGEVQLDFSEGLRNDTDVEVRMRMGEMSLRVPDNVLWDQKSGFTASLGEIEDSGVRDSRDRALDPELTRTLRVNGAVLLGGMVVSEFRARPRGSLRGD